MSPAAAPPRFIYGTAWKEECTAGLVELALQQGFRGIDTANQRKHYVEAAAGEVSAWRWNIRSATLLGVPALEALGALVY